jgi:hypothetical protein
MYTWAGGDVKGLRSTQKLTNDTMKRNSTVKAVLFMLILSVTAAEGTLFLAENNR